MFAGLLRGRAPLRKLLLSPVTAVPVTMAAAAGVALVNSLTHSLGISSGGVLQLAVGTAVAAGIGYASGMKLAAGISTVPSHQRGTIVVDQKSAAISQSRQRDREDALTLAGVRLASQDETKHFKFIGTTGTGKSTAIHEVLYGALKRGDSAVIADPDGG